MVQYKKPRSESSGCTAVEPLVNAGLLMMFKAVILTAALLIVHSAAQYNSTKTIALSLDATFRTLSGNVVGDQKVLFGTSNSFGHGKCCTDKIAFAGHPQKIDLVIALDESGSVGSKNFNIMKAFIEDVISHFVVSYSATRVAVVTWSTRVDLEFNFGEYINYEGVVKDIRKNVKYSGGWTATGNALNLIRWRLFSRSPQDAKKVLFIITDGRSNRQSYNPATEARLLKNSGVEIFAFGIGKHVYDPELIAIASTPTNTHKFRVEKFNDLSALSHLIAGTGCRNHATVYDACGRRCKCRNGKLTDCKRVRKNYLDMTDLERCRYIRAVRRASTVQPFKSEYDTLIGIHEQLFFTGIHSGDYFLPWNRWYILAYENILRKVDCRVTVPYWDWSLDSDSPFTSDVWNSDLCKYTGLGGNGNPSGGCVTSGPFASPGWTLTPSAQNDCLRRGHNGDVPDCTVVQDVLDATVAEFDNFLIGLEVVLHNTVHVRIGGTMRSLESSNAPEFFFHHGFIDKIWGDWQEKGLSYKRHEYYRNTTSMPGTIYSPRDVHDIEDQPYCVKVCYDEPKQPCKIGGRSLSLSQVAGMSLAARLRLDPTPVPEIPQEALTQFGVPKSVVKRLPEICLCLFGVHVKISGNAIVVKIDPGILQRG